MAACWSTEDRTARDDDNSDRIASSTVKTEKERRMLIWSHLETPSPETRILKKYVFLRWTIMLPNKGKWLIGTYTY